MKLKINKEYEDLVPRLNADDYQTLKNSIQESGIRNDLHVMDNGTILCGHSRFKIAKELGIKNIPYKIVKIQNKEKMLEYIIMDNLARRQLTTVQKVQLGFVLERIEAPLAKQRMIDAHISSCAISSTVGKTRQIIADKVGIGHTTFQQAKKIKTAAPEIWDRIIKEDRQTPNKGMSISSAYNKIKNPEDRTIRKLSDDEQYIKSMIEMLKPLHTFDRMYMVNEMKSEKAKQECVKLLKDIVNVFSEWIRDAEPSKIIDIEKLGE
jgi:ParB-like chromosome segregation protein Spo0J